MHDALLISPDTQHHLLRILDWLTGDSFHFSSCCKQAIFDRLQLFLKNKRVGLLPLNRDTETEMRSVKSRGSQTSQRSTYPLVFKYLTTLI